MNTLAAKFNVPTFPLADGMFLGRRDYEEYQWLIERGTFTFWLNNYMIMKTPEGRYQLLRNNAPEPELEAEASTLDALIKDLSLPITQFQWHPNWEDIPA